MSENKFTGEFTEEQIYIQDASELLAKVNLIFSHLGRVELVSKIQEIKDELNSDVFKMLGEDVICTN